MDSETYKSKWNYNTNDQTMSSCFGSWYYIFYAPTIKKVIAHSFIKTETSLEYMKLKQKVEIWGFTILGIVLDGRKGIQKVFNNIPIQMCQFHQLMILRRYLTMNPRLEPEKELKQICKS